MEQVHNNQVIRPLIWILWKWPSLHQSLYYLLCEATHLHIGRAWLSTKVYTCGTLHVAHEQASIIYKVWCAKDLVQVRFSYVENVVLAVYISSCWGMAGSKKLQVYEVQLHATFGWIDTRKRYLQTFYMYHTIQCIIQSKGMLASNKDEHKFCASIPWG